MQERLAQSNVDIARATEKIERKKLQVQDGFSQLQAESDQVGGLCDDGGWLWPKPGRPWPHGLPPTISNRS